MVKCILPSVASQSFYQRGEHEFCKSFIAGLILSFVALSIIVLPIIVGPTKAFSSTIYVPDNYSTIQAAVDAAQSGDTIIVRDGTYTENVDVDKALTIRSENGADSTIVQAANSGDHVFGVTAGNVKINGFTVKGATEESGICIQDWTSNCEISHNYISDNYYGILLQKSSSNTIENNTLADNRRAISLNTWCTKNIVANNDVHNPGGIVIDLFYSHDNRISDNNISVYYDPFGRYDVPAIGLFTASNNEITRNQIKSIKDHYIGAGLGIILDDRSKSNLIGDNLISDFRRGIILRDSSNDNIIRNNSFTHTGLFIHDSYNNDVQDNTVDGKSILYLENTSNVTIKDKDLGQVILVNCENITVANLSLLGLNVGVELLKTNNSTITNNHISAKDLLNWASEHGYLVGVERIGVYLEMSANNTLNNNKIEYGTLGIKLENSSENTFYLNNMVENLGPRGIQNVESAESSNIWNSPEPITYTYNTKAHTSYLGNYWSDYTGSDADGDGIGDTPYSIDSDKDNYPLMKPFENYPPTTTEDNPPTIEITSPSDGETISGTVRFSSYATDDHGLEKVEFYIDDELKVTHGPFGPDTVGSTCNWDCDTTPGSIDYIPNGSHTFKAKAYDTAGQTSVDTISFIVHNVTVPVTIQGKATLEGATNHSGITIEVWLNGLAENTVASTTTGTDGSYQMSGVSSLSGSEYYSIVATKNGYRLDSARISSSEATPGATVVVSDMILHNQKWVSFNWVYQPDGTTNLSSGDLSSGSAILYSAVEGPDGSSSCGFIFSTATVTDPVADVYFIDSRRYPYTFWANNGSGGVHDMGAVSLESVTQAPDASNGVGYHEFYDNQDTDVIVGHTYCIVTKDGARYAKIYVTDIGTGQPPAENQPPTCAIELRKEGTTSSIDEINIGEFFDIYVGGSTDDTGIDKVRFSSDDSQDGNPTGEWTNWYNWASSSGDWNAETKIKKWSFATSGDKEVWAEVKDDIGQTDRASANIYVHLSLLEKYAPVLYLHEHEKYWPWGIDSMLNKAELWEERSKKVEGMDPPISPTKLKSNYNNKKYYLNLQKYSPDPLEVPPHDEWDGYTPRLYGRQHSSSNHIVLQYWFFYPFNKWKINNHEGDWEMAQVILDKTENPIKLCLAWHHHGNCHSWEDIKHRNVEETHPKIFVTLGGHGCWPTSGDHNLGLESPLLDVLLYDETSENGKVLYPQSVNPSSIKGKKDEDKKIYELVPINNETSWVDWEGKWGEKWLFSDWLGWNGPKSPANIKYWGESQDKPRWEDPIGWCNQLKEGEGPSHSRYIASAQSTLLDISLHAYDESKLHVGETETGEIEATIPGAYIYTPSYYSDDQKEWMWIDSSGNLRFEIKARSSTPQSSHTKGSTRERSNLAFNAYQSQSENAFNFAFNRYLKEENEEITITYQNVPFTETTVATVDVNPENPMFIMQIDNEVRYPSYIEGLLADIPATMDIDPDTLNLESKGKWITCYIELPEGYDVNNIDIDNILLMQNEGVIAPVAESSPTEVGDYDENGIPDLMVKFDRATLITYLEEQNLTSGEVTLKVIGQVDNKIFEGTDTITIKGGKARKAGASVVQPKFGFSQNYPNPCNPETTIEYSLAESCQVTLKIYNISGQLIKTLVDEYQDAGYYKIMWYGDNDAGQEVASGVYFYSIKAGDFISTKKMVVLK